MAAIALIQLQAKVDGLDLKYLIDQRRMAIEILLDCLETDWSLNTRTRLYKLTCVCLWEGGWRRFESVYWQCLPHTIDIIKTYSQYTFNCPICAWIFFLTQKAIYCTWLSLNILFVFKTISKMNLILPSRRPHSQQLYFIFPIYFETQQCITCQYEIQMYR